jgi:alpha-amylase
MNILGDFINRVNSLYPLDIDNDELESLLTTIKNQGDEIEMKDKEIIRLKTKLEKLEEAKVKETKAKETKKPAAKKKAPAKKEA